MRHRGHHHDTVAEARACEFGPKPTPEPEKAEVVELHIDRPLPDGDYTVELGDDHRTLRLAHQAADDTFMPGRQLIGYLSGPDNERNYKHFGHVSDDGRILRIWRRFRGNTQLAMFAAALIGSSDEERDAMHSGRCARCHRKLTAPASKNMGLGPVCAEKF